jgi:glycosyltransferase involved in cell wall biosynthesis
MVHVKPRRLNILHVATINTPISSQLGYSPVETVIYNLDKGLHARGHRSIVACSADSRVAGERHATVSRSLGDYLRGCTPKAQAHVDLHLARALERAQQGDIDVVHMHEWFERVYDRSFNPPVPIVMTLHVPGAYSGIAEFNATAPAVVERRQPHFVAISDHQREEYAGLVPVSDVVPHGVDADEYVFRGEPEAMPYLLSIGRISPVKGQDVAIEVARRSGAKLIIAGCVQDKEEDRAFFHSLKGAFDLVVDVGQKAIGSDYFERVMQPILASDAQVVYIGEVDTAAKKHWFRHAQATLFPVQWGEPFGMVLIESMASGTPIVGFRRGAVPEIVKDGKTGFVIDSVDEMVDAVRSIAQIDRRDCRRHVEERYSIEKMAEGYEAVYERLARAQPIRVLPKTGLRAAGVAMRPVRRVTIG